MAGRVLGTLLGRGLLEASTRPAETLSRAAAAVRARGGRPSVYLGVDPTADGLHVGHLAPVMAVAHAQRCGLRPVLLVGGATALVGDPSGKDAERSMLDVEQVAANAEALRAALAGSGLLDAAVAAELANRPDPLLAAGEGVEDGYVVSAEDVEPVMANNADWYTAMSAVELVRDVGRHFRLGTMLARDSVQARMASGQGMSFTEFTYSLLQGYDFLHLHRNYDVVGQVGGADQWGNIVAGTELIRRTSNKEEDQDDDVIGITVPLLTTKSGAKFGKTAGNAVWLSPEKTSHYAFYQYFLQADDAEVEKLLQIFTFLGLDEIDEIVEDHMEDPDSRRGQHRLATEVTKLIRGHEAVGQAERAARILFGDSLASVSASDLLGLRLDVPFVTMTSSDVVGASVVDVAVAAGVSASKGDAKRLLKAGGMYLNNERANPGARVAADALIGGEALLLRSGRKKHFLVHVV